MLRTSISIRKIEKKGEKREAVVVEQLEGTTDLINIYKDGKDL